MRRITRVLAVAALALAALGAGGSPARAAPAVGDPAPDFGGNWQNHASTTLADLKGRVVFIVFWRTW
jgi:hypothetical protein